MPNLEIDQEKLSPQIWKIAAVAVLGSLLAQIDATVVNVSLSALAVDLHSTLRTIQWVTSGYLLALALLMPLNGWLVDRFGVKRLYLWCFGAFTLTSALCATSWSAGSLIAFRVLQGMAGGLLAPMAQLIMVRAAGRQMAKVLGYTALPILLGPLLGPVVAGAILSHLSWQWLFLVNLPIGALAFVLAVLFLPRDDANAAQRPFDWGGFFYLVPGLVLFLFGTDHVVEHSGQACIAAGVICLCAFVWHARSKGHLALLDLDLFRSGAFAVSAQTQFLWNGISFATQMLIPLYLIRACGRSPAAVGLLLLPLGLGMMCVYPTVGSLTGYFGLRKVAAYGSLLTLLSVLPLIYLSNLRLVGPVFVLALLIRGIGQGAIGIPTVTAAYSSIPKSELPMATTTLNIIQRLGGPTLTTVLATFLAWRLGPDHTSQHAFTLSFVLLGILHALLLGSAIRLPKAVSVAM